MHQITKPKYFSSRLPVVFAQSIEARCSVDNEDVVGAAPTGDAPTVHLRGKQFYCLLRCGLYKRFDGKIR